MEIVEQIGESVAIKLEWPNGRYRLKRVLAFDLKGKTQQVLFFVNVLNTHTSKQLIIAEFK